MSILQPMRSSDLQAHSPKKPSFLLFLLHNITKAHYTLFLTSGAMLWRLVRRLAADVFTPGNSSLLLSIYTVQLFSVWCWVINENVLCFRNRQYHYTAVDMLIYISQHLAAFISLLFSFSTGCDNACAPAPVARTHTLWWQKAAMRYVELHILMTKLLL